LEEIGERGPSPSNGFVDSGGDDNGGGEIVGLGESEVLIGGGTGAAFCGMYSEEVMPELLIPRVVSI